ncbi:MAG: DUF177 domain-containing protein [Rhodospirillales bacterium]|nr:DUF177 domain-containing protein [Rhodospirillales bacterium]
MPNRPTASAEFARDLLVDGLTAKPRSFAVAADAAERAALAKRLGLQALPRLEVAGEARSVRGDTLVRLSAHLLADVVQTCVVSLAPVPQRIEADFERLYAVGGLGEAAAGVEVFFDEADDDIDPVEDGRIDVGEAAAEQLALELDPYPRAPAADIESAAPPFDDRQADAAGGAFASLAKLRPSRAS